MSPAPSIESFNAAIWRYYATHQRDFPWRRTTDPYRIFVSEMMLQQTQTGRVIEYFQRFTRELPDWSALAGVSQAELLKLWQGLGYNRRALYLQQAAKIVVEKYRGTLPSSNEELITLPGVGPNTAGAISAYAFNKPVVFIETNIRKGFIHWFFADQEKVDDKEILPLIAQAVDPTNPREWYWAVVDYGWQLGRAKTVRNSRSRHYHKQSPFEGSNRQVRSLLLKNILAGSASLPELIDRVAAPRAKITQNLADLITEGFIEKIDGSYVVKENV